MKPAEFLDSLSLSRWVLHLDPSWAWNICPSSSFNFLSSAFCARIFSFKKLIDLYIWEDYLFLFVFFFLLLLLLPILKAFNIFFWMISVCIISIEKKRPSLRNFTLCFVKNLSLVFFAGSPKFVFFRKFKHQQSTKSSVWFSGNWYKKKLS